MASRSKQQLTMAKRAREQAQRDKRADKARRKEERIAAAASGEPADDTRTIPTEDTEAREDAA